MTTMAAPTLPLTIFTIFFSVFFLVKANTNTVSFNADLMHRDSPKSPFYDPSVSPSQRIINTLHRSFHRANHFKSVSSVADIMPNNAIAEYLMKITIGTPPHEIFASVDMVSDIIWTQCQPCSPCYAQNAPIFSPRSSSTYNVLSCNSSKCKSTPSASCLSSTDMCQYVVLYSDSSYSYGDLATDTVAMGSTSGDSVSFPDIVFGCGHNNSRMFSEAQSGIIGLGGGPSSLISQMSPSIGGKFSYCLVPMFSRPTKSSKMYFGDNALVSGYGVVSTPLYTDTFYHLTLEGISVGGQRLEFNGPQSSDSYNGNTIIDLGTLLTYLPPEFYQRVESAVRNALRNIQPIPGDPENYLNLCYDPVAATEYFPKMTVHFKGADVMLDSSNTFVQINDNAICLAFLPSDDTIIFGNLAQINFLVGYDREKKTVSFKHTDCTKL